MIKNMGADLDFMQFSYVIDRKQTETLFIGNSDILRQVLKALIDIMEKDTSRANAISNINKFIENYTDKYDFLKYVAITDVRYTLGVNEININQEIDSLDPTKVGQAIETLIFEVNKHFFKERGGSFFVKEFKNQLTLECLSKIKEMGVNLNVRQFGHELVFKHVIKALIDVLSKISTQRYAVFAVNTFLRKVDTEYDFLKYIKINPAQYSDGLADISIMTGLDEINEEEARRAIQRLLEEIADSLGEEARRHFINKFSKSLGRDYLLKIEEMGVNLHMIQLRQNLR
jgi:hypothetical protein